MIASDWVKAPPRLQRRHGAERTQARGRRAGSAARRRATDGPARLRARPFRLSAMRPVGSGTAEIGAEPEHGDSVFSGARIGWRIGAGCDNAAGRKVIPDTSRRAGRWRRRCWHRGGRTFRSSPCRRTSGRAVCGWPVSMVSYIRTRPTAVTDAAVGDRRSRAGPLLVETVPEPMIEPASTSQVSPDARRVAES